MSPPVVKTGVPAALLVIEPAPVKEPTVSLKLFKSNVAVTETALASGITPLAPNFRVPAFAFVVPTYEFAPEIVQLPVPAFIMLPVIDIGLVIVPPTPPPKVKLPVPDNGLVLFNVNDPAPPTTTVDPFKVIGPLNVAPVTLVFISTPPPEPFPAIVSGSKDE